MIFKLKRVKMKTGDDDMEDILNKLYRGEIHPEETYCPEMPELIKMKL